MSNLQTVSRQWASRPDDERFVSLYDMRDYKQQLLDSTTQGTVKTRALLSSIEAYNDNNVCIKGQTKDAFFTNWSFGQVCRMAGAPADYLRTLPADLVRANLLASRAADDMAQFYLVGNELKALTSPSYGRIHDLDVVKALCTLAGDGVGESNWRVPGEFGRGVVVNKDNTTLYASDRDMFVFLADEQNKIEVPGTHVDERPRLLSRGFYVSNSEVGNGALTVAMFLFDYVCSNRIVWGVSDFKKISIRHTSGAPSRMLIEARPVIEGMRNASSRLELDRIESAQRSKIGKSADKSVDWLVDKGFSASMANSILMKFVADEQRPVYSKFDMVTAVTGYAKTIPYQNDRVRMERQAGSWL